MLLGEFLTKYITLKNISYAELSRQSGVPASTIRSMVKRNNERVSIDDLIDICKVLGCNLNEYVESIDKSKYTHSDIIQRNFDPMKIGDFLKTHLKEKKMSQAELARRSGIPATTISSLISKNSSNVSVEMLAKFCQVLECDINEYIDTLYEDEPVSAVIDKTKKSAPIDRDRFLEMIEDFSDDELYELYVFLKFLIWKRDHSDID